MSKKKYKDLVLKTLAIGIIVIAVIVVTVILVNVINLSNFLGGSGPKATVDKAYKSVSIPSDLKLTSKTQTGDSIDSPDQLGWQYVYSSNASTYTVHNQLLASFSHAGFDISNEYSSKQGSASPPATYSFTATKKTANATFDVEIDGSHIPPSQVNISGLEIHHE